AAKLERPYSDVIVKNQDLIRVATERNPRQVKQFLNSFMIAYDIFSRVSEVKPAELLAIQALRVRWSDSYRILSSDKEFRAYLKEGEGKLSLYSAAEKIELRRKEIEEGKDHPDRNESLFLKM